MEKIIDGKAIAAQIREEIASGVATLKAKGVTPGLAVVLVGDDPASQVYVRMKEQACEKAGIFSDEHKLPAETTEAQLLALIEELNRDERIDGILVQLPLPKQINESKVLEAISPKKDVDGFHPYNVGRLVTGNPLFQPCTPYGVMKMIEHTGVDLTGKEVVVVGRSNIVGKPVALMCLAKHATVTICHSRTKDLAAQVAKADVLIAAVGQAGDDQGRLDQAGGRGHRCRRQPGRREEAGRRRRVRRGPGAGRGDHPGSRRGRPDDHHHAACTTPWKAPSESRVETPGVAPRLPRPSDPSS